jgi:dTDP-4-dehydrorhamnose 3,5-epimerase
MTLRISTTPIEGVLIIDAPRFTDDRGWFTEVWNEPRYRDTGLDLRMVQHNVSQSGRGVLRGMHFQAPPHEQGKLITVLHGAIFDAVVDIRTGSPDFGRWYGCELSAANGRQLWVPEGFAHGFLVLSESALVQYGCTAAYHAPSDRALAWDDPRVGIEWPEEPRFISDKDRDAPTLAELESRGELPSVAVDITR